MFTMKVPSCYTHPLNTRTLGVDESGLYHIANLPGVWNKFKIGFFLVDEGHSLMSAARKWEANHFARTQH